MVRLGKPVRVITEPGLNAKIPFVDSVIYIDKRILAIESPAQEVIASSQDKANAGVAQAGERLVVDAFARYRITDPLKFYQTVGPDGASSQLSILLNSALRRVLGAATLADAVRNRREALMMQMREQLDRDAQPFGIEVVDVRIRRVDLPEQNSQAVYQRMQTERQREAAEFRAQGSQKSQEIRARADRDVTVLLAEANVPYPQLKEMDEINPEFARADVALVIGANDVTNPAARRPGNAISGMPILDVDQAKSIIVVKRSMGHGYAGMDNELYANPKTSMYFADAKRAVAEMTSAVKTLVG